LEHALARSGRYEDMIRRTLREEGVPQELIYLAQAESGFHLLAVSRAGARGMWQFMAAAPKATDSSAAGGSMTAGSRKGDPRAAHH